MSGQKNGAAATAAQRVAYFDLLRVLASAAVVVLHLAAQNWGTLDVSTSAWRVLNLYDGLVRWSVPVFVMISGALFLSRPPTWEKLWRRHIARIAAAFAFWTVVYGLVSRLRDGTRGQALERELLRGHYHMWYLFMILGLYLIVPFLTELIKSERLVRYFMLLSLVATFLLPQIAAVIAQNAPDGISVLGGVLDNLRLNFVMGFTGYFLLGWYLHTHEIGEKAERLIYGLGAIGLGATVLLTKSVSLRQGVSCGIFYGFLTTNVLMAAAAVYLFAKQRYHGQGRRFFATLSRYSFGVYLVHPLVIETLGKQFGLTTLSFHPALAVPLMTLPVLGVSYAVSWALSKIPVLGKYIV